VRHGPDLMRYKGILYLHGLGHRVVFQGVHMMMGSDVGRPWAAQDVRESKLVFIGRDLPEDVLRAGLQECLVQGEQ
jgi:G3E family GTPase